MNASTAITFRTIKAAEAAGFHRMAEYLYGGEQITVKGVLLVRYSETARSTTAWRQFGRKVISGSKPHAIRTCRFSGKSRAKSVTYAVYRQDQTLAMQKRKPPRKAVAYPFTSENVLAALFAVNRSAKRYRDAAQTCYQSDAHGFAKAHKKRKEKLYDLKEQGLVHAYRAGFVVAVGLHGSLTVYRGAGYCFHSPVRPENVMLEAVSQEAIFVEAKPRQESEMRLRDAVATLEQLANDLSGFFRHSVPRLVTRRYSEREEDSEDDWDDQYDEDY